MAKYEETLKQENIGYIQVSGKHHVYDDSFLVCEYAVIKAGEKLYRLMSRKIGESEYRLLAEEVEDHAEEVNARKILSTTKEPIRFVREETEFGVLPMLRFEMGNWPLMMSAGDTGVMIGLSHWDADGNRIELKNRKLLNDGV